MTEKKRPDTARQAARASSPSADKHKAADKKVAQPFRFAVPSNCRYVRAPTIHHKGRKLDLTHESGKPVKAGDLQPGQSYVVDLGTGVLRKHKEA
jgi:hypothetical protein